MPYSCQRVPIQLVAKASASEPRPINLQTEEPLWVVVDGTSIIGTMLGTDFSVTYQKQFSSPHLVRTHMSTTASGPAPVTMAIHQFRARAFHAAVEKARELGWIRMRGCDNQGGTSPGHMSCCDPGFGEFPSPCLAEPQFRTKPRVEHGAGKRASVGLDGR